MGDSLPVVEDFTGEGVLGMSQNSFKGLIYVIPGGSIVESVDGDVIELLNEISVRERFSEGGGEISLFGAVVGSDVVSHRVDLVGGHRGKSL